MKREIKFRAWDYQNNRWATNNDVAGSVGLVFGIKDYFINIAGERAVRFSFQQHTGLKDKNGKEIYEGDILVFNTSFENSNDEYEYTIDNPATVIWDIRCASFWPLHLNSRWRCDVENLEVIGNIYQNPDLLK